MRRLLLLTLLGLCTMVIWAQAETDTLHCGVLDELVVSATRWSQKRELQPMKISRLSFEEFNAYNPQTAADMLSLTGEVFVQKSQYGGGSPMIRGFATNRLLYSVDGVRMNNAIFRAGNLQQVISLDPFAIASTEVLFGPSGVSYGSDAIGGVMVFNTLQPRLSSRESSVVYGSATLRTATASNEMTTHVHAGVGWRRWALLTSFTTAAYGDLKQGMHGPADYVMPYIVQPGYTIGGGVEDRVVTNDNPRLQAPSGYSQYNIMQKVRFVPSDAWEVDYAFHLSETSEYARYDRHQRMQGGLPRYAEWNYGPQEWMMHHLALHHTGGTVLYDSLRTDVAWQRFGESRISRNLGEPVRETQTERVDAWSVNLDFIKALAEGRDLSYGAEYVHNRVASTAEGRDVITGQTTAIPARYPYADWYSAGLYAQAEWRLHRTLNIAAGIRYNHYLICSDFARVGYDVPFDVEQRSHAGSVSGNVGLNWRPGRGWLLRANYARGFRAPNVDDMGKLFDSADGHVTVPNPSLRPEYADNYEVGVAKHFGSWLTLDATAYYTHLTDAIVRRDYTFDGRPTMMYQGEECIVQALQNAAVARVWGLQVGVRSHFARCFYADVRYNWQRGFEELDNGAVSPLRHAAPPYGRAAIGLRNTRLCVEAYAAFQLPISSCMMPEEERGKTEIYALDAQGRAYSPAWAALSVRASYAVARSLRVNVALENVTDVRYRPYASGISAPGRNLTLGVTYDL